MLFDDFRELLLDLPALTSHVGSLAISSESDAAYSQMPLGGALQQLAMVVTMSDSSFLATPEQVTNATQSYGGLREMKRVHSKLMGTPHHIRCNCF